MEKFTLETTQQDYRQKQIEMIKGFKSVISSDLMELLDLEGSENEQRLELLKSQSIAIPELFEYVLDEMRTSDLYKYSKGKENIEKFNIALEEEIEKEKEEQIESETYNESLKKKEIEQKKKEKKISVISDIELKLNGVFKTPEKILTKNIKEQIEIMEDIKKLIEITDRYEYSRKHDALMIILEREYKINMDIGTISSIIKLNDGRKAESLFIQDIYSIGGSRFAYVQLNPGDFSVETDCDLVLLDLDTMQEANCKKSKDLQKLFTLKTEYSKISYYKKTQEKYEHILENLVGKTIKSASIMGVKDKEDAPYMQLEFEDGEDIIIASGYGGYVGDGSVGEYPNYMTIHEGKVIN